VSDVGEGRPGLSAAQEAARAVGRRMRKHTNWHERAIEFAKVLSVKNPMKIELFAGPLVLEEDRDWKMSQFLRWWDMNYQLMPNDVLMLARMNDDTWVAFDVRTARDVEAGIRPSRPPATPTGDMRPAEVSGDITYTYDSVTGKITQNHHIARKLEVFDKNGVRIGFVPVYGTLP
jgi:hypothetical protein